MSRLRTHPLVKRFIDNARQRGAGVYGGRDFATAVLPDGKQVEILVDPPKRKGKTKD